MIEALRPEPDPEPDDDRPRPGLERLRDALRGPFGVRSRALSGLFVLAAFYTLYFGRAFFLPIVLALLLSFLLSPVMRALRKLRIPAGLGAALVVLTLLGGLGWGVYELAGPAYDWAEKAPVTLRKVERKLRDFKKPVQTMSKATEQVEKIAKVGGGQPDPTVSVRAASLGERMLDQATGLAAGGTVMVVLLFFLLASGDLFLHKLIGVLPRVDDKKWAVEIARQIETEISTYLVTVTVVNAGVGVAVWGITGLLGAPNPLLWGVLAAVANYIPFLGPFLMTAVLGMVGFLTFPSTAQALLVPLSFLGLHGVESYLVTPTILGRRLTLDPVIVFLSLIFWGWLWGIAGAILAVPIMVVLKIFCDHSEPLRPIGELLGG